MGDRGQGGVRHRKHVPPLGLLVVGGVRIYTDHRNLIYISDPEACVLTVPKIAMQRLETWKMVLAQYNNTTMHISGERNCCGDLLSRWVNVPVVAVRAVAVFASNVPDETMPSMDAVHEVQQQARAGLSAMVSGASSFTTPVGRATKDKRGFVSHGAGWSKSVVDPGIRKGNADPACCVRSNEGRWTRVCC